MNLGLKFAVIILVTTQIANISTTMYLHRGLSHRALKFHPVLEAVFRFLLWLTTTTVRQEWVAVHRKHHAHSDQEGDPHSPAVKGFWNIQLWNYFYYRKEANNSEVVATYSKDIPYDWFDRFSKIPYLAMITLSVISSLFLGPVWGVIATLTHYLVYVVLSSTINGACHTFGYRHHDNLATNIWTVAMLTAGEGFHNNHHDNPARAKLGMKWYEVDVGWIAITLLSWVRMVKVRV